MSDITEEEAKAQLASLSEDDLMQRIADLQDSKAAALQPLEGIQRAPSRDRITKPNEVTASPLDQNIAAKHCGKCGMDNAEIAQVCSACDEPLGRILLP